MSEQEKKAIEYLKARLYGNEGCELIDVAQSDLRIIIKLVDRVLKADKNWQEIYDDQEENIREKNNKICEFEFIIENQQKELNTLKEIEQLHKEENGKLRVEFEKVYEDNLTLAHELEQEKEKNESLSFLVNCYTNEYFIEKSKVDKNYIHKDKIKEIRDKAEVMDYYTLCDVIDDLSKLVEEK